VENSFFRKLPGVWGLAEFLEYADAEGFVKGSDCSRGAAIKACLRSTFVTAVPDRFRDSFEEAP
jgi:hypothetical protein